MKIFFVKTFNIICICMLLFMYQDTADKRQDEKESIELQERQMQEEMRKAAKESGVKLYEDGEYEGKGKGFGGDIVVKVIIKDDEIESAEVVSADNETPEYIEVAKALLNDVISYQSSDVDTISGATLSSNGILEGVRNALDKAKAKG